MISHNWIHELFLLNYHLNGMSSITFQLCFKSRGNQTQGITHEANISAFPDIRLSLQSFKITGERRNKKWYLSNQEHLFHFLCSRERFIESISWKLSQSFSSGKFTYVDLLETQVKTDCLV